MKKVTLTQLRRDLVKIVEELAQTQEHITVTRYGKPVAVLLPVSHYEHLVELRQNLETSNAEESAEEGQAAS